MQQQGRARKRACFVLIVLMCFVAAGSSAEQREPFTNEDVLEMVEAGFAEETVLEALRANDVDFDTSVKALLALKEAGAWV